MSEPTNNIGSGNIAVSQNPHFAGSRVFDVDSKTFHRCRFCKLPNKHYSKYLDYDEVYQDIREYASKNPKSNIIVRDKSTGVMTYLKQHHY